jgi:uncharacterized protein (TIGR00255 family)
MTGFGLGEAPLGSGKIIVEIRAVNARFLDVRVRTPRELSDLAMFTEQLVRERLSRGRCEVVIRTEGAVLGPPQLDRAMARAAYRALMDLRDELAPGAEVPFSAVASIPDLFRAQGDARVEETQAAMRSAIVAALSDMDAMRLREGGVLSADIRRRADLVRQHVAWIRSRAPEVLVAYRQKLRDRIERAAAADRSSMVDEARLEQDLIMFADRCDITEELLRLDSHLAQLEVYVTTDDPTGRRLDFLLQEMSREINTVGSKAQDSPTTKVVVEVKAELERMREQVQNVE